MKRFFVNISLLVLFAGSFSACKKQLADNYANPELSTTGSMSKLLSGMFFNKRIHPSYWDYYTFIMPTTASFSQTTATPPADRMYVPNPNYGESRWVDFYAGAKSDDNDLNYVGPGIMSTFREMQTTYAKLSPAKQAEQLVFLQCAKVVLFDQTSQMIDLWGDIPFSKAGSLNTTDRPLVAAPFENAAALYDTLITGLNDLNTYFENAQLSNETKATLTKADLILNGNLALWRRYANSLRLRLLMRISYAKETSAKTEVTNMLGNPTKYPLISDNTENVLLQMSPTAFKSDMLDALGGRPYAPAYLLDTLMAPNNDPRTAVYWDAGTTHGLKGFPVNGTTNDYDKGGYATYDSATFYYNYNLPGVIFTASEVSFLKAEAGERWGIGTSQTEYEKGINQSIGFYYNLNKSVILRALSWSTLPTPSAAEIALYNAMPTIAYSGTTTQKLAKIWTQKWIHFFILQAGQAWAEVRRTGYPALSFAVSSTSGAAQPPKRLLYPSTEQLYNTDNYAKVAAQDKRDVKIFWDVR